MHLECLVEERSIEAALTNLLPKILTPDVTWRIHAFQGKQDLKKRLPERLRGYKKWIPDDYRIVVLIDKDRDDCYQLKRELEEIASRAQFITKTSAGGAPGFQVMNHIVIEELESWFFGDLAAIRNAYPKVSRTIVRDPRYAHPDTLSDTWETRESVLQHYTYYPGGLPKIEVAQKISRFMAPERNRSQSFQVFCEGIRLCTGQR